MDAEGRATQEQLPRKLGMGRPIRGRGLIRRAAGPKVLNAAESDEYLFQHHDGHFRYG